MRRFLLSGLLLALLTGCTPRTVDENAVTHLRVWVGDNADVAWMEQVVRDFSALHPDKMYDIQIGVQNEGDAAKTILADMQSAADVFTFADDQLITLINAGEYIDRKSTRLNSSHGYISYAVFCLKKKK